MAALLAGCGGGEFSDLQEFVAEVDARPAPPIRPLPPFTQVEPFAYEAMGLRSPFEPPVVVRPSE
ncbi:MAG: pilus assembly protein PilP, partial [Gammaproteobacteria bacterium]